MLFSFTFVLIVVSTACLSHLDYVITLNTTDSATVYCFSDYLEDVRLVTDECSECQRRVQDSNICARGRVSDCTCSCVSVCGEKDEDCLFKAGEHTTCLRGVKSRETERSIECVGYLSKGSNLTITIQIVRHSGNEICYGNNAGVPMNDSALLASGMKMVDPFNKTYYTKKTRDNLQIVTYDSPVMCINSSNVNVLKAGHLVGAGYTLDKKAATFHRKETRDLQHKPTFENFCVLQKPRLWKIKEGFTKGTKYQCNGSLHVLNDEFPCLQFPPVSGSFKLPNLDNCSVGHVVGVVLAMIVATVVCYVTVVVAVKLVGFVCRFARTEKEQLPLATTARSTASRLTISAVKQASRESMFSQHLKSLSPQLPSSNSFMPRKIRMSKLLPATVSVKPPAHPPHPPFSQKSLPLQTYSNIPRIKFSVSLSREFPDTSNKADLSLRTIAEERFDETSGYTIIRDADVTSLTDETSETKLI